MGLEGETPEGVDTHSIIPRVETMYKDKTLNLNGHHSIPFVPDKHLIFHFRESLPQHPNGMRFSAYDGKGDLIATNEFFSIGGGFVVNEETKLAENAYYKDARVDHAQDITISAAAEEVASHAPPPLPDLSTPIEPTSDSSVPVAKTQSDSIVAALPFYDAESLLRICETENLSIAQVVFRNELQWRSAEEVAERTLKLWDVMNCSIQNGIASEEEYLPGQLRVRRRAPALHKRLMAGIADYAGFSSGPVGNTGNVPKPVPNSTKITRGAVPSRPARRNLPALDWISLYALAVNEENAAGGNDSIETLCRVVTAPTNGAAGTIPAVLKYYLEFICPSRAQMEQDIIEFMLTAAAIGMLYKRGASISAAEMGCQGEVGVACSMAAAAFTAVMGGTVEQIENAAEIGMEHNLGLTCDPPMGLVVIPCIERNALAAVKAVTAAQLALNGDGSHRVTLDQVIATMRQTGIDMMSKYKETSEGGLAVNVPVC
ncbi:L-serine ammonia-lyase [Batrachochytrium dendrobatidis JEL423]|uniref:L-serine ammonia-lyase n=1 Tax=Batrachochytrium dendrobatidis (strain JEL423) TaxID=403673 RepID=A0A177WP73_BATDL|nr:L-serine ammonia-lyase [Batrachochytrium dendrobatidis JEL423]